MEAINERKDESKEKIQLSILAENHIDDKQSSTEPLFSSDYETDENEITTHQHRLFNPSDSELKIPLETTPSSIIELSPSFLPYNRQNFNESSLKKEPLDFTHALQDLNEYLNFEIEPNSPILTKNHKSLPLSHYTLKPERKFTSDLDFNAEYPSISKKPLKFSHMMSEPLHFDHENQLSPYFDCLSQFSE